MFRQTVLIPGIYISSADELIEKMRETGFQSLKLFFYQRRGDLRARLQAGPTYLLGWEVVEFSLTSDNWREKGHRDIVGYVTIMKEVQEKAPELLSRDWVAIGEISLGKTIEEIENRLWKARLEKFKSIFPWHELPKWVSDEEMKPGEKLPSKQELLLVYRREVEK